MKAPASEGGDDSAESERTNTGDEGGCDAKLRRENASWRRKLRASEQENAQLRARLEAADRADVERQVTGDGGIANPADFLLTVDIADLRDDDGALDADKVQAARDKVLAEHPNWRHQPLPNFDGGARESAPDTSGPSFAEALKRTAMGA